MSEAATVTAPPTRIGPYRVLRSIARGGMAEVYEVQDPVSGERYALKLLLATGTALQRFNREYEAMIRLNHPNIVRVYQYGAHDGKPWLTMELLSGTPVQVYAKDLGRPGEPGRIREVIRIGHDIARALDHIHRRGLVHRDLKSANVLVLADGRVKLLDFGTARVLQALEAISRENEFLGTFAYASPEQIAGRPVDGRSDLYSLGILLYRLLTGALPFNHDDPHQLARMQLRNAPKAPRDVVPEVPDRLDALVMALLEKRPQLRPETGAIVANWLEEVEGTTPAPPNALDLRAASERLVGREPQLITLRAFFAANEPGGVALLVGEPLGGRDALLRRVSGEAADRHWGVHHLELTAGDALGDLARGLAHIGESAPEGMSAMVSTAVKGLRRADPGLRRKELIRTAGPLVLGDAFKRAGATQVITIAGLGVADEDCLVALRSLRDACARQALHVLFIGSADESADDPGMPLREVFPEAVRVHFPALNARQTALLVGALLLRRPPPAAVARRIHRVSGGRPGFVTAVVTEMLENHTIDLDGNDPNRIEWAGAEHHAITVPGAARDLVFDVLATVPFAWRRVLEACALLGDEADWATVVEATGQPVEEVRLAFDGLRRRGLVGPVGRERIAWRQRLVRDVLVESMSPARRAALRRRIGSRLTGPASTPPEIQVLVAANRLEDAVRAATTAAEAALKAERPQAALDAIDVVLEIAEDSTLEDADVARVYLVHARALALTAPTDPRVGRSAQRAAELAGSDPVLHAELAILRADVQRIVGHYPNHRAALLDAWGLTRGLERPDLEARIAEPLSSAMHLAGLINESADWSARARASAARQVGAPFSGDVVPSREMVDAEIGAMTVRLARGRVADAEKGLTRLIARCEQLGDARGLAAALPAWVRVLRLQGRYSEALAKLVPALGTEREGEVPSNYLRLVLASAWIELDLCRLGRAQELVDELVAVLRRGEHLHIRLEADLVRGRILVLSGNLRQAIEVLGGVWERGRAAELVLLAELARAYRGEALAIVNKAEEADAALRGACTRLEATGDVLTHLEAVLARTRALAAQVEPTTVLEPLRELIQKQPLAIARLEWFLAAARHARENKLEDRAYWENAKQVLDVVRGRLDDTERSAIRVHPWNREIRARLA